MKSIILFALFVQALCAQDFGFAYYSITDYRSLGASYNVQEFSPSNSNTLPDSLKIRFTTALPFIEYREMNARVAIGYQEYTHANKTLSSFSVYVESGNDFPLTGREQKSGLFLPIKLSANYVKSESGHRGQRNFDIGSLGVGTGIKYRFLAREFGLQVSATGALHFSNVGFGTEYGSQTAATGEIQVIIPNIVLGGLTIGYRYDRQQWNMNDSSLDCKRYYHGVFVGMLF